jgi:tetratricopeptide (TPR) repeat protein
VDEVDAPYPVGLLYLHIGVLYGNDYDYQRAIDNLERSIHCFEENNMERLANVAKRNIGLFYLNMQQFSYADSLLNEVLVWGEEHNETSIIYGSINLLLRLYDATENTDALDSLFKRYPIGAVSHNATTYGIIAHHYARKGEEEAAMATLSRAWEISITAQDTATLWHKSYQLNKTFGRAEAALRDYEYLFALQDSTVRISLQQPLIASQLSHYQNRLEVEELRNLNYRYLMGIAALVIVIVAVVLWMLYREAFRKKEVQVKQYMDAADQLRVTLYYKEEELGKATDALQQQATDTATLQQRIASLFKEQYNLLDELCTTYYENPKDDLRRTPIFEQVRDTINFFSSDKGYARLEAIVNDGCNDAIARLRREFPKFKETDFRLLCYFCAELSVQSISLLTDNTPEKLWVYKGRLIKRIKSSDAPSKDIILAQIPQRKR